MQESSGPENLALLLALMTAATIAIISTSYSQIIENFPTGGGGYVVATKLLTISVSIASGADALLSLAGTERDALKLPFCFLVLAVLMIMNLRGVKEPVVVLIPIFLTFLLTHGIVILCGSLAHIASFGATFGKAVEEMHIRVY